MSNQNETVLITGASTGIGRAVARAFLDRDYNLVLNSRDPGRLEAAYQALGRPDNAVLVAGDVSDKAVGQQMVAAALHKFGRVDVLVNNAGVFSPNWVSPSLQFRSLADLESASYAIDLMRTYFTSQVRRYDSHAIPRRRSHHGRAAPGARGACHRRIEPAR